MISPNGLRQTGRLSVRDVDLDGEDVAHLAGIKGTGESNLQVRFGPYIFKAAESDDEMRQVHRLNYLTFVEEVGQHPDPGSEYLVDKFHDKNTYLIALHDGEVVGMLAIHDQPPFSLAERLPPGVKLHDLGPRLLEARLFAIKPDKRMGAVSRGLLWLVFEYANAHDYSHLVISGIESRRRFYERMGFRALGPAVVEGETSFLPMALDVRDVPPRIRQDRRRIQERFIEMVAEQNHAPVSLLPGPVHLADTVRSAVSERPESHRGDGFIQCFESARRTLSEMVGGLRSAIMVGSGTLANEVVAATLAADRSLSCGLILIDGEFGGRLAIQASRHELDFATLQWEWGEPWNLRQVRETLDRRRDINWIWGVHLETSTGRVNNIEGLFDLAESRGVHVCLDCVSSLGALEMDLSRAYLATGVSGKSIGALAGLAFIFAHDGALDQVDPHRIPTYLDLRAALETVGPRFTVSSPLMNALARAMEDFATPQRRLERYRHYADLGAYVRRRLKRFGMAPLVDGPDAAPVITSFLPPDGLSSAEFCELCLSWGFEISGLSGYLLERGLAQIATMGDVTQRDCARLFAKLRSWLREREKSAALV